MFRFFEKLVDPYQPYHADDVPPAKLWPFLASYMRPFRNVLIVTALLTLAVAGVEIGLIFYAGRIVDLLEVAAPVAFLSDHGVELLFITAFILFLRPTVQIINSMLLNQTLMPNIATLVRWRSHRHVLRQSVGWFQNDFAGRIANRVMQTAPATGEAMFQVFDALVYAVIYLLGALVLLGGTDVRLMLPLAVWSVAYILLCFVIIPRIGRASKEFSDARSAITGRIVDSYTNIQTVKLFSHTREEEAFAGEAIEVARVKFQRQMRLITQMELGLLIINGFLIVAVIGWAIVLWQQGIGSVGTVAAASALVLRLNAMTGWIMWALSSFFQNLGVVREGMETIAQPIDLLDAPEAAPLQIDGGQIAFNNVTHQYGRDSGGLQGVNLTIRPGERVGLVGRSGAGKSTLVNLLLRFHDVETGQITIDGQPLGTVTQDSLRQAVGMVTQDTSLLHRSVRDNVCYGTADATDEQVIAAAKRVEAHDFILDLEDMNGRTGYDAHVGERGVKLSGGQRQRIALARVVLKNAPILVLDEATSALDSEVEAAIQQALYGMMEGKTVIAIAHRLSTIAAMDRIVVLDGGRIVEDGTHEDLIAQGGQYAGFWARQSGGFLNAVPQ
ncbi:ATP-binding cassette, subfamily B, multidrug efflux pump [Monaibacterium marinum]|uniref:ATP-binding cassette, subfamily B, multidrug efflux pump n=1 Tax=Pontivivens marinum TaxID=1690039 RepID=A0A2C9CUG3_9RHOB|nr:ABC transporter ATP-binding protein [Monaibacterium marinum]SOH94765.1 ATP-binding cassette, subfamily B, multidrug efflux pump [Monaibacterium marinum]